MLASQAFIDEAGRGLRRVSARGAAALGDAAGVLRAVVVTVTVFVACVLPHALSPHAARTARATDAPNRAPMLS
jgi:hypothetical protein